MTCVQDEDGKRSKPQTSRYSAMAAGISGAEKRVQSFVRRTAARAQQGRAIDERQRAAMRMDVASWSRSVDRCRHGDGDWDALQARAMKMLAQLDDPLNSSLIKPPKPKLKKLKSILNPNVKRRRSGSVWTIPSGLPGLGKRK